MRPITHTFLILASIMLFISTGKAQINKQIILDLRLPSAILSFAAGAILSMGGSVFQGIFRNPLADPYILGISAASATGACLAIVYEKPVEITSFIFGILSALIVILAGYILKNTTKLLLAGVALNSFLSAIILFIYSTIPGLGLQKAMFFTLGFIEPVELKTAIAILIASITMLTILSAFSDRLNAMSLGDVIAFFSGVHPSVEKIIYIAIVSGFTSLIVSKTGIIGFVGIIIPNILRFCGIRDFKKIIPGSFTYGGTLLIISEYAARNISSPLHMPVGVITAILGAPLLIFILWRFTEVAET